jgi:hypothetical protein
MKKVSKKDSVITIASFDEGAEALRLAEKNKQQIVFENAPHIADVGGVAFVNALKKLVLKEDKENRLTDFVFNANDNPMLAISALKAGFGKVRFSGTSTYLKKLCTIANQYGATILFESNQEKARV